jgi:hypothetical protein
MKIPKTINLCGQTYKIRMDPNSTGGTFSEGKKIIEIGTAWPADVPENLLHEVIEGILAIRNARYTVERVNPDNGDYIFVFKHDQYEQLIKDIAAALKGIEFNDADSE